jgi:hypothetical protein
MCVVAELRAVDLILSHQFEEEIGAAPRIKIFSASLLQRASPLYSTFQPYICCTTL